MNKFLPVIVCLLALHTNVAWAEPDGVPEKELELPETKEETGSATASSAAGSAGSQPIYIPLKPPFVVNYGGPGRLRYLKADIAVRLENADAANSVRHHMPYLRNNLVMLFSAQTEESLKSQAGKEALRQEALREVRDILMAEDQQGGVVDLYFNSLTVQN